MIAGAVLSFPFLTWAHDCLLKEIIVSRNRADLEKSLQDGSYRGEAGILRILPVVARSLGMKVSIPKDYLDARAAFALAESFLEEAKAAMTSRETEPEIQVRKIAQSYLQYRRALGRAKQGFARYRETLLAENDERLQPSISEAVLDRLLAESLEKAQNRLRDALGYFYNACRGTVEKDPPLTQENVDFVNEVFYRFREKASGNSLTIYGFDRVEEYRKQTPWMWKKAFPGTFQYESILEETVRKHRERGCEADPALFLALMRRESSFDSSAVSSAGAAGLTQMMPGTALDLGVKNVFWPEYFTEAGAILEQERRARGQAMAALHGIEEGNATEYASRARALMQEALEMGRQREKRLVRYRVELLEARSDDRLNPAAAIEVGYRYFCALMKEHDGDISLALAAYNAGSGRVREYKGIPPFAETVRFRNRVIDYYFDYLKRLQASSER